MNSQQALAQIGALAQQMKRAELSYAVALEMELQQVRQQLAEAVKKKKEPTDGEET